MSSPVSAFQYLLFHTPLRFIEGLYPYGTETSERDWPRCCTPSAILPHLAESLPAMSRWTDTDRAEARKAAEAQLPTDLVGWCDMTHPHDMIPRRPVGVDETVPYPPSKRRTVAWDPEWINARGEAMPVSATPDPSPEVQDALDALPSDAGRYVYAVYGLGWSTREAAVYFGVSQSTVTRKARAGLKALQDLTQLRP